MTLRSFYERDIWLASWRAEYAAGIRNFTSLTELANIAVVKDRRGPARQL